MSLPLRWKLVALYALILAAVIGGLGAAVVLRLRSVWNVAAEAECRARAAGIAAALDREGGAWVLDPESGMEEELAADRGFYFAVHGKDGLLLASPLAEALGRRAAGEEGARRFESGGATYREVTVPVTIPADPEEGLEAVDLRIVCGKDMEEAEFSLGSLVAQLLVVGPLVLIGALAAGFWLVSRALAPIDRMAKTAEAIGASDLSRRIAVEGGDELARLGRTLNATFARLEDSFERQRRFTADASHELRTPLAVVAGNVELALRRPREAEEYREILGEIREATVRMQAIVEGLLTLARADAGKQTLAREPVAVRGVLEEVLRLARPLAAEHGVELVLEPGGDAVVSGDGERLKELFSNLVMNGIRYNRRGGRVAIGVGGSGERTEVTVADTGVGIAPEHLPHVFERFYRADGARSREQGGTGLGLAIARWIVEAHGGSLEVASEPGVGTRFVVGLPAAGDGVAEETAPV